MRRQEIVHLGQTLQGTNVLITGGCGFIGSHLVSRLREHGCKIRVFDRDIQPVHSDVWYIQGDVRDYEAVARAMGGIDIVFHLAGLVGVELISNIPYDVLEVNLQGTVNALKAAQKSKVKRFLFASSSEVYGQPKKLPIAESDDLAPISVYGIAKLAAETYCQAFFEQFGLPTTRVRYFNVYGPGQKERFVIPIFISRVLRGEPPVIYGHGDQRRCYTYVDDAVRGTILAAISENGVGEVFNIGNDQEVSILELAEYIIRISGNDLKPIYKAFGDGIRAESREIFSRRPDILKARTLLGFDVTVSWQEGVKRFMEWYKEVTNRERSIS
jgi:UDP-glucose 4-epimerase